MTQKKSGTLVSRTPVALYVAGVMAALSGLADAQTAGHASDAAASAPASDNGQPATLEEIVVSGTRIQSMTDGSKAPTPVTVVSTASLQATTPSDLPDALNKLPVFQGSQEPRRAGDGSSYLGGNILNLRNFGSQRTLVLLDGHRLTPTESNGTVSVDTIPQMLIQRVDVVTAGASAVYGSDAVTGVVNFILDKKFDGLKADINYGESTYWDGSSYKVGAAFGHDLFGGRGHILASAEQHHQDAVPNSARAYGRGNYVLTGSGTAANPFTVTADTTRADSSFGGKINSCAAPCSALGEQFVSNGVLGPFNPGAKSGTANQNAGGDGAFSPYTTALVAYRTDQGFLRFDYDVTDDIDLYAQASAVQTFAAGHHFPPKLTPVGSTVAPTVSNSTASVFFKDNPFLSAATQTALGNNGLHDSSNVFSVGQYMAGLGPDSQTGARSQNNNIGATLGLDGRFDGYHWEFYYSHGRNTQTVYNENNSNFQHQFAALDAVTGPNGTIQCYAATQAATAAEYANCVPLNPFGPTAMTPAMFNWFTQTTWYRMTNTMDDLAGSFAGSAFDDWAGPVQFAVSAEARHMQYEVDSNADPAGHVDCTGLRICNPSLSLWAQPVSGAVDVTNDVQEGALEFEVPLLADLPFAKAVSLNLAGRDTHYRVSGTARTWKTGLVWDVNNDLRFRGTLSVDIRAPTLADLYQPTQASVSGFVDLHTATSNTLYIITKGNPNLVPEKARTHSFGVVYQPSYLPGLTTSIDVYEIRLDNAIGQIAASNTAIQQICETSNGTSPYCALYVRPHPFSDHTADNFPTNVYSLNLNTALAEIRGLDFESSYHLGGFNTRLFATWQPTSVSQSFSGAPLLNYVAPAGATSPKTRITTSVGYQLGDWAMNLQDNWQSGYSQVTQVGQVWATPHVTPFNTVDANLEWKLPTSSTDLTAYFTVQNLFNAKPDIVPAAGSIGLVFPVPAGQDIMGRYLTIGFRAKLL